MYPILINFGGFALHTYGLFVALGFAFGMLYLSKKTKKLKPQIISQDDLFVLVMGIIISAMLGARAFFLIFEYKFWLHPFLNIFKVWEGGLTFYGGFILAFIFLIIYVRKKKISLAKMLDLIAPAAALGHFFGRIGCFMAGCCHGKPTDVPWGVVFTEPTLSHIVGIPVHPAELYEAFGNLTIFFILNKYNKKERSGGRTFALYMLTYSVLRFVCEFFRGDFRGSYIFGLSPAQFISIFLFICGLIIMYRTKTPTQD
ncbi:MAG: prolipoprotein diacylglyceryl transferase [Elusimicrobiota bacterium]|jgi:phosphatidylglycerol:prolipoprotein diacylglycerol transferase|nr:prolipoprotein diacylglyceryl transferase [Elusimicrobiota bacterium]